MLCRKCTGKCDVWDQVREETGLDITGMLVEEDCIERHIKQQRSKLYIVTGVRGPCLSSCTGPQQMPATCIGALLGPTPHTCHRTLRYLQQATDLPA